MGRRCEMKRLYIDGIELPLLNTSEVMPRYDMSMLRDIESWRSGEDIEVEVMATPEVDSIMLYGADIHRAASFNDTLHEALLTMDDIPLFEGVATLIASTSTGTTRSYTLRLRRGGAEWAKVAALTMLNKSDIECEIPYTIAEIERTWSGDQAVRLLPLQHDSYPDPVNSSIYAVERVLMPHEYHPFISVKALLDAVIKSGGYRLRSGVMESELFKRLMMSGAYRAVDGSMAEAAMGFKAYRTFTSSLTASQSGMVSVSEPRVGLNIGAIVDTTDADAVDESGNRLHGAYDNGDTISFANGNPLFTPKRDISVSFEYFLHYTTECRMLSRTRLQGFTNIHLANGCDVQVTLQNPYTDRRNSIVPNVQYRLIVFDHEEGNTYLLNGIAEGLSAECNVTTSSTAPKTTQLYVRRATDTEYTLFEGEWAIYDGHVRREFEREVQLTVRTPFESVTPTSPRLINDIMFSGAIEGQKLTLHSGCSMRGIFSGSVGYGDYLRFEDIAHHNMRQIDVMSAVAHLFNLCFYSHEPSRTLYIEPYDTFFNGPIVDWRERQRGDSWSYDEGLPNCFERVRLAYGGSDGVVTRLSDDEHNDAGWTFTTSGYGSKMGVESRKNPIFFPTASLTDATSTAPSAEILTVGNRDTADANSYVEPRIVLYHGLCELPNGERWQAYDTQSKYPFASFHSPNADATLDFSDRDNLVGLHSYYDRELRECAERGVLVCDIAMSVDEYMALLDPMTEGANVRSRFRLRTEYGSSLFILQRIEKYDAESHTATCCFRRMLVD